MPNDPSTSIYLTYKTRMLSEAKCKFRSRFANILVAWYSLWLIALSIIDLKSAEGQGHALFLVIISVFVFALSLIVPALGLDEKAVRHRECYLRLQRLKAEDIDNQTKVQKYYDILEGYPNHPDADWDEMLVKSAMRGQTLQNTAGDIVVYRIQYLKVYSAACLAAAMYAALTLLPLISLVQVS
jgi:hypothetical protein